MGTHEYTMLNTLSGTVFQRFSVEGEGFEPPVPFSTTVFKTVVLNHSTILPKQFLMGSGEIEKFPGV